MLENVETVGWFKELFRADYESMSASVESVDQMLEIYLHGGEYGHKEYHPIGNFVSGILDITIIKPFIESIYGYDLITGEKLTDFERGMQLVNAVVGAVTLGQGALALNFAGMSGKEAVTVLVKIWAVDAVADMSAYTVGYACDELGMPAGITFLASLATGCTVSVKAGKYVFQDASGSIVKELDADGMQAFVKELGVDLGDLLGGGKKGGLDIVAYHSVGGENSAKKIQSVLDGIDIRYTSPESRFGQGFYVAADGNTTIAELVYHGTDARYSIRYNMNLDGQKVLDLTDFKMASEWGYSQGESSLLECQNIAEIALEKGYDVIKVQSYRDAGINYVIFNNFDEILQPQMVTPIGE